MHKRNKMVLVVFMAMLIVVAVSMGLPRMAQSLWDGGK